MRDRRFHPLRDRVAALAIAGQQVHRCLRSPEAAICGFPLRLGVRALEARRRRQSDLRLNCGFDCRRRHVFWHRRTEMKNEPNKAPEPTTFAVTSRATVRFIEMKPQNPNRNVARVAPAKVAAHL